MKTNRQLSVKKMAAKVTKGHICNATIIVIKRIIGMESFMIHLLRYATLPILYHKVISSYKMKYF